MITNPRGIATRRLKPAEIVAKIRRYVARSNAGDYCRLTLTPPQAEVLLKYVESLEADDDTVWPTRMPR